MVTNSYKIVTNSDTVLQNGCAVVFALFVTRCLPLPNIYTYLFFKTVVFLNIKC